MNCSSGQQRDLSRGQTDCQLVPSVRRHQHLESAALHRDLAQDHRRRDPRPGKLGHQSQGWFGRDCQVRLNFLRQTLTDVTARLLLRYYYNFKPALPSFRLVPIIPS